MSDVFPRRGEIWLVNFNPVRGSEQKGIRPALIMQNNIGNEVCNGQVKTDSLF